MSIRLECPTCTSSYELTILDAGDMLPVYCPFCGDWPDCETETENDDEECDHADA